MFKKILFSLIPAVVLFGLLETGLRSAGFDYTPHQRVLWKPTVGEYVGTLENYYFTEFDPPGYIWIRKDNISGQDNLGHREYAWPIKKKAGVTRVAFLGGSTSEPGDDRPYPQRCVALLNAVGGTNHYEELNVACASYSSHQSLIAFERYVLPRNPDVVVVYHGWNDAAIMDDGFADRDKDDLLSGSQVDEEAFKRFEGIRNLAVSKLLGKVIDSFSAAWPRPRVSLDEFRSNLESIARQCEERGIRLVIVEKPLAKAPPSRGFVQIYRDEYGPVYGNSDEQIYRAFHDLYTRIQREVAERMPAATLAPAAEYITTMEQTLKPDPEGISIFTPDACHMTGIGYQRLGEIVAMSVVPELKPAIEEYIQSPAYWRTLAGEFRQLQSPIEIVYATRKAIELDPSLEDTIGPWIQEAEALYEFVDLFEQGRWGGTMDAKYWPDKLKLLQRCLEMQPSDFGVILQMFRVCQYTGHIDAAADFMKGFQPATAQDQYQWLHFLFQSHLQGQRWQNAEVLARNIQKMAPSDPQANSFLRQIEQHRVSQRL